MLHRRPPAVLIGLVIAAASLAPAVAAAQTAYPYDAQPAAPVLQPPPDAALGTAQAPGQGADAYTIRDIPVDETAASAAQARDKAIADAQRLGLDRLVQQLAPGTATPKLNDGEIDQMVLGVEVQEEHSSAVRYVATYTVHFKPSAVRARLAGAGVRVTETRPHQPAVIVPVFQAAGSAPILWEDRTAWRSAWEAATASGGPLSVPPGELEDIAAINVRAAVEGDPEALRRIAARYGGGDAVVARLSVPGSAIDPGAGGEIQVLRRFADGRIARDTLPVPAAAGQGPQAFLKQAIGLVRTWIDQNGAAVAGGLDGSERHLRATLALGGLSDLLAARQRLAAAGVVRADVVALSRAAAVIDIAFRGDPDSLRASLGQQGLALVQTAPDTGIASAPATPAPSGGLIGGTWELQPGAVAPAESVAPVPAPVLQQP